MSYLASSEPVSEQTARQFEVDRARVGYLPNYSKTFADRPEVYAAWRGLNGAIKAAMPPRHYELATLAAATRLRSSYCALAHGQVLAEELIGGEAVETIMRDPAGEDVPPLDSAIMVLAERVASDAAGITEADLQPLRDLGLADVDIFDVILAASARCFFSSVLEATGTEPDAQYELLDPSLRVALTVGRPIAAE